MQSGTHRGCQIFVFAVCGGGLTDSAIRFFSFRKGGDGSEGDRARLGMHVHRVRKRADLVALTHRANPLKDQTVAGNVIPCFAGDFVIQAILIRVRGIRDLFTADAKQMVVQIGTQVVTVGARHPDMADLPLLTQKVQIAVDRSAADVRVDGKDIIENLIRRRMVASGSHCVKHRSALLGFSSDHSSSVLQCPPPGTADRHRMRLLTACLPQPVQVAVSVYRLHPVPLADGKGNAGLSRGV